MAGTNLGTAYVTIMPSAKGLSKGITSELSSGGTAAGTSAGTNIVSALKGVIAAAGIGTFFKKALDAGGALQQSFGGLETIYGDASGELKEFAYQAAQAGISANDYAEQAVSFGAALKKAYEYDSVSPAHAQLQAARQADQVIHDMADNAAKMGTDITSIQNAYQGFAKQNYTMLDNLKLGYGGTKAEMERLLEDAEKLSGHGYNIENLADVYEAIHVVQEELGLAGVAAAEGADTFTGSMSAMKASAENLMANLALGKDIEAPLKSLVGNTKAFLLNNMLPMIGNIIKQIPHLLGEGLKSLFGELPGAVEALKGWFEKLPEKIKSGTGAFVSGVKDVFSSIWESLKSTDWKGLATSIFNALKESIKAIAPQIGEAFVNVATAAKEWFMSVDWPEVGKTALTKIGDGIGAVGSWLWEKIKEIAATAVEWWDKIDWKEAGANAFRALVNGLKAIGSTLWNALKTIGSTAAEHFKNSDVDWKDVGKKALTMIGDGLTAVGSFLWEALKAIGSTAAEWFKDIDWLQVGKDVITFIWDGLGAIGHWIWEKLKLLGDAAAEKFKEIDWKQVGKDVIEFIWNGLGEIGSWIWEKLTEIGGEAVEEFKNIDWLQLGKDVINTIWSGITELGSTIWEGLKGIGDIAKSWFDGVDWYNSGMNAGNQIANGLYGSQTAVNNAASYIASMMQAAINGQSWVTTGANIVYGVTSAYTSPPVARTITKTTTGLVSKLYNGVRSGFGIDSPSKLMRDGVGVWIPAGIAEGIKDNADVVTDAMKNIASDTVNAFDTDFAYDGTVSALEGGAASSDSITVNVYPSAGMNERQLADMVQQRLALAQRQKQAAWGTA